MSDDEIDLAEVPELDTSFFRNATLRLPQPKEPISLRLDHDVLDWFKRQGRGYQTRINAVLRIYVEAKSKRARPPRPGRRTRLAVRRSMTG